MKIGDRTPWGPCQSVAKKAQGIYFVETASHGGFKVEPPLLEIIPARWRAASFGGLGSEGWFEEDCDWALVALTFPTLFSADTHTCAQSTYNNWIAKKVAA